MAILSAASFNAAAVAENSPGGSPTNAEKQNKKKVRFGGTVVFKQPAEGEFLYSPKDLFRKRAPCRVKAIDPERSRIAIIDQNTLVKRAIKWYAFIFV